MLHSCINLLALLKLDCFQFFRSSQAILDEQLANTFDGVTLLADLLYTVAGAVGGPGVGHRVTVVPAWGGFDRIQQTIQRSRLLVWHKTGSAIAIGYFVWKKPNI